ncbi:serine racemase isoform X6 [Cryptomeria japonica]|uniref:serine racemase isoform X6 n=1 Tax=Cryptomeria japonica TaxID=3369 RepID=UPI0027DA5519|nr:serine racemase isoform X6 [Cryptomeria japonica]
MFSAGRLFFVFSTKIFSIGRAYIYNCKTNFGKSAALALAAKIRGTPAYIVIPKTAPACKVENVRRYGGQVIWCEPTIESRESVAARVQEETGAVLIHPFNDGRIISGQGTISLELLEQVADLDAIVVPISDLLVGKRVRAQHREQIHKKLQTEESVQIPMHLSRTDFWGGLISGVAIAAKALKPDIHIFAAEPKGADDAARSKVAGRIITLPETKTIADGLRAWLGDLTWPIVRDLVDDVIVVEEREIVEAMKMCYEILKVVVEPSGAIGLAAVLSRQFQDSLRWLHCKKIGVVLSGANIDLAVLWESFQKLY